jgi:hypothetical protein
MVWNLEVEQLVDNYSFSETSLARKKIRTEADNAGRRARCPFAFHLLNLDSARFHTNFLRPASGTGLEFLWSFPSV